MNNKTEMYELTPTNGRKSFYGKAKVVVKNGWRYLRSYETIMGGIDPNGTMHRYSDYHTMTTGSHVKSFFDDVKSFWKLPVEPTPELTIQL